MQSSDFYKPGGKEYSELHHSGHAQQPTAQSYEHHHVCAAEWMEKRKISNSDTSDKWNLTGTTIESKMKIIKKW